MARRIKSLVTFSLYIGENLDNQSSIWSGNSGGDLFKSSTNMSSNHWEPDSGHIPRMILALPYSQSDNNNSASFVRLLNTNSKSPGSLSATRNNTYGSDFVIVITWFGADSFFLAFT